jgi:hypothetical protein
VTYTSHGHHIAGTITSDEFGQIPRARCGGPILCSVCAKDANSVALALEQGKDASGLFDAPEISKDAAPFNVAVNKIKLSVVGARNNVVEDEGDEITVDDLAILHISVINGVWRAYLRNMNRDDNLLFVVDYLVDDNTTTVKTFINIETDIFSQEGN